MSLMSSSVLLVIAVGGCLLLGASARPQNTARSVIPELVTADPSLSCVAAGFTDCCVDPDGCVVRNEHGSRCYCDASCYGSDGECCSDIQMTCHDPYQLEITSSADSETVGKPYSLNCTVEVCPGTPSIVWLGPDGREVTTGGGLTVEGPYHGVSPDNNPTFTVVLTFNPLRTSHAGEYNCESEAGIVARRRRKDIDVHIPTPSVHLTQDPPTGRHCHGDNLTLTCTILVDPSVDSPVSVLVQWIGPRQGLTATPPTLVSKGTYQSNLTFNALLTSDSGNYLCDATVIPEQIAYVKKAENGSNSLNVKVYLKVSLAVDYTPPPDFDYNPDLGLFRAASGPFTLYCEVAGNTGAVTYYIQGPWYTPTSNPYFYRSILHARDTGNYTCTATDASGFTGEASTTVKVIGAGVSDQHSIKGLPNNSISVMNRNQNLHCRSGTDAPDVGEIIGLDGNPLPISSRTGALYIRWWYPYILALAIGVDTTLSAEEEGVYTCRITDENGETVEVNFGLYRDGFNKPPRVISLSNTRNSILNCTSTDSPPATVTWTRDGRELTVDGTTYTQTQRVIDRRRSTYENILSLPTGLEVVGNYSCRVKDSRQKASNTVSVTVPAPFTQVLYNTTGGTLYAGTALTITCRTVIDTESLGDAPRYFELSIKWFGADGAPLSTGNRLTISTTEELPSSVYVSNLVLDPLHSTDAGIYTCVRTLELKDHLNFRAVGSDAVSIGHIQSPVEVSLETNMTLLPNEAPYNVFSLTCTATTIPPQLTTATTAKTFVWKRESTSGALTRVTPNGNGIKQRDSNVEEMVSTSVLTVRESTAGGYRYHCQVDIDGLGLNSSDSVSVQVNGPTPPLSPYNLRNTSIGIHSSTLEWRIRFVVFTPETYLVRYGTSMQTLDLTSGPVKGGPQDVYSVGLSGLVPGTTYYYVVIATNSYNSTKSSVQRFTATPSDALFQVHLPMDYCTVWSPLKYDQVISGLLRAVAMGIAEHCSYSYSPQLADTSLDSGGLSCHHANTHVTFRGTVHGTSRHSAEELLACIEQWVAAGPSVQLGPLWVNVDSSCTVLVGSISDPECPPPEPRELHHCVSTSCVQLGQTCPDPN